MNKQERIELKWFWMMDYCKKHVLPAARVWKEAEKMFNYKSSRMNRLTESEVLDLLKGEKDFFETFNENECSILYNKMPDVHPGDRLQVYWKDYDYEYQSPDIMYVLALPSTPFVQEGNMAVHVTKTFGEKGEPCKDFLIHMIDLVNNDMIDKLVRIPLKEVS